MYDAINRERLGGGYPGRPCDRTIFLDVPSWVFVNLAAPTLEAAGPRSPGADSPTHYESMNGRGGNEKVKYENPRKTTRTRCARRT